ncbi:kelch domain-containing protein 10 [Caerostris darwini]|uniref:Kelch domain-containing protein 10 n=1 Tax=Caerostris darwini TaxID=1538125 RepID=A0AAV4VU92_9ARAC|nr:kelch domain-containing protein 10 [Caerostris darwini]
MESETQKKIFKRTFKFSRYKITKQKTSGNHFRDVECPEPRSGHRIVVLDGNVYTFGGYTPIAEGGSVNHLLFKQLWRYNVAARCWKLLESTGEIPEELASHSAALLGSYMLVYGGTGLPFGETSSNSVHICNLNTLEWSKLDTEGTKPDEMYGQAMIIHDNKAYVVGGTTGYSYSMDVHCLDVKTKTWTNLDGKNDSERPPSRYRHEIAFHKDRIYVFGGGTAFDSYDFKEVPFFDLTTSSWNKVAPSVEFPEPRRCHGCVQVETDVYICGGFDGTRCFSDIWKFDLNTHQWKKLSVKLPTPLYFHSVFVTNEGQLFVFGGVDSIENNSRTNTLYSMWLKIPSLSQMAWQAMLNYTPHIARIDKSKLYEAGIPLQFIKQIDFDIPNDETISQCCSMIES